MSWLHVFKSDLSVIFVPTERAPTEQVWRFFLCVDGLPSDCGFSEPARGPYPDERFGYSEVPG